MDVLMNLRLRTAIHILWVDYSHESDESICYTDDILVSQISILISAFEMGTYVLILIIIAVFIYFAYNQHKLPHWMKRGGKHSKKDTEESDTDSDCDADDDHHGGGCSDQEDDDHHGGGCRPSKQLKKRRDSLIQVINGTNQPSTTTRRWSWYLNTIYWLKSHYTMPWLSLSVISLSANYRIIVIAVSVEWYHEGSIVLMLRLVCWYWWYIWKCFQ